MRTAATKDFRFVFEIRAPISNAMSPEYDDGDQAVISTGTTPMSGDHVVALIGETLMLRVYRLRSDGAVELSALNSDAEPFVIDDQHPGSIVGVAVEKRCSRRRKH